MNKNKQEYRIYGHQQKQDPKMQITNREYKNQAGTEI